MFNYAGILSTIPEILASTHDPGEGALERIAPEIAAILIAVILLLFIVVFRLIFSLRALRKAQAELVRSETPLEDESELGLHPVEDEMPTDGGPEAEEAPVYGRLIVLRGLNDRVIPVQCEPFVIGRSVESDCDYVVDRPYISPQHSTHLSGWPIPH